MTKNEMKGRPMVLRPTPIAAVLMSMLAMNTHAQVDADCTGTNPGTVTCSQAGVTTYTNGIVHATNGGDLTVNVGADVVSFGTGGFTTTATGTDSITMTKGDSASMSNNVSTGTTSPAVIRATTEAGDISISTGAGIIRGPNATAQYGIYAESTAGGDISITAAASVTVSSGMSTPGIAGILARTQGGTIDLNILSASGPSGALTENTTGTTTITGLAGNYTATATTGDIAIIKTSTGGSGNSTATTAGNITVVNRGSGGVTTNTSSGDGDTIIRHLGQGAGSSGAPINVSSGSGSVLIEVQSETAGVSSIGALNLLSGSGGATIRAVGNGGLFGSTHAIVRGINAAGLTGSSGVSIEIGNDGRWVAPDSVLTGAADIVNISANGQFRMVEAQDASSGPSEFFNPLTVITTAIDFGGGVDQLVNEGLFMVGPVLGGLGSPPRPRWADYRVATLSLQNLEIFRNSGTIFLGAIAEEGSILSERPPAVATDRKQNDILHMPGTHFIGEAGSRIKLDAALNLALDGAQDACDPALRVELSSMPVSDCIDIRGGQVSGRTAIDITDPLESDRGAYNPGGFVLVDAVGATIDPEAFFLGDQSSSYSSQAGGIIDKGVIAYALAYDESAEQFKLYGVEGTASQQFPMITQAANDLWRTSASAWFDRQVDQRDVEAEGGRGGGIWLRTASISADRDLVNAVPIGNRDLTFDNSHRRQDATMTFGIDLLSHQNDGVSWVIGPMLGYARSKLSYENSTNSANLEGFHYGLYGSLTAGKFYVDAALNEVQATVDNRVPAMDLPESISLLRSDVKSLGGQIEAGWRLSMGKIDLEPLASFSHTNAQMKQLRVPNSDPLEVAALASPDDAKSTRAGLGLRLSVNDLLPSLVPLGISLTGKVLQESDGVARVTVANNGPDMVTTDTFDGTFSQLAGALSITNRAKTAAGFLNLDTVFGDDYSSLGFSAGFRYQW